VPAQQRAPHAHGAVQSRVLRAHKHKHTGGRTSHKTRAGDEKKGVGGRWGGGEVESVGAGGRRNVDGDEDGDGDETTYVTSRGTRLEIGQTEQ